MTLRDTTPLEVPGPVPVHRGACYGVAGYQKVDQAKANCCTCWAAAATSALLTFFGPPAVVLTDPDGPEADFAKRFWGPQNWNRGARVGGVLDFAGINASTAHGLPDDLKAQHVRDVLGAGRLIWCLSSARGASHVLSLWWTCQQPNGDLVVTVHDPLNQLGGVDTGLDGYQNKTAYAAGMPPPGES